MIKENVIKIVSELPEGVELEAACKARTSEEVLEAINAGVRIIGENYVQEAEEIFRVIGNKEKARWHFIGHLQENKVKRAVKIFDMIETIDSFEIAEEINKVCAMQDKIMPVLIEINSGREKQKSGVYPEDSYRFINMLAGLPNIKVLGLMTMGPMTGDPEDARQYFVETKRIFDKIRGEAIPNTEMRYLSMGMSDTYRVAIEEGANIVRIGTNIFSDRQERNM